jgi:peptidyl-tRNA hydrolase, PTH1 family
VPVVVGLGNPGPRYARTRHNAGWQVVEILAGRWGARPGDGGATYRSWRAERASGVVDLVEPLTFMNRSGAAVAAWRERHAFDPADLLVVTDDVYLPIGIVRLRPRGTSGGHRGLESIAEVLGTEYARLRIGVGETESGNLREHVLDEPGRDEAATYEAALRLAADAVECWVDEGILVAMNRYNRKVPKEVSES